MSARLSPFFVVVCAAFASCPTAPAPDPLPEPPRVVKFTVSPTTVLRGETVSIKWETTNAVTIDVADLSRGSLAGAADKASGEVQVPVTQPTVFVISAKNSRGARASSVASVNVEGVQAAAVVFTAYPPVIAPGQPGLLVWNAPNARRVQIAPMGGQALDLMGQTTSGSVEVSPTATETTYVLTADGVSRTVTVVRGQGITDFTSSKAQVKAGDSLTLSWRAENATKLRLSSPGRGVLRETTMPSDLAMGSLTDTVGPQIDGSAISYVLEVEGRGPVISKLVTVYYGDAPTVLTVTAPKYVKENLRFPIVWTTVGADRIEVRSGPQVVYRTPAGANVASGSVEVPAPATSTDYVLAAISSPSGATATKTFRVTPVTDVGMPTFAAMPTTVASGGTPVTLTWNVPGAIRTRIVENGEVTVVAIEGSAAVTGTATVYPNANTTSYELRATNTLEPIVSALTSVAVTTPATITSADGGTIYQSQGTAQVAWTIGGANSELVGFGTPTARVRTASTGFTDISMTGTALAFPKNANDAVLSFLPIDFETFLGGHRVESPVWVSTNGFLQFSTSPVTNARPTPVAIPSATATTVPEDFVAPFWADLDIGGGGVFWEIVGTAPQRELIVQWNQVRLRNQPSSSLTFQARLHQGGAVSFEYQTFTLGSLSVPSTIGYQGPLGIGYAHTFTAAGNDAGVQPGTPQALTGLSFGRSSASPAVVSTLAAPAAGQVRIGTGAVRLSYDQIVKPTDIFVSEVMNRPNPAIPQGQWLEIANFSNATVDMSGWQIGDADGGVQVSLGLGTSLAPRSFLVVAPTADPLLNDGLPSTTVAGPGLNLVAGGSVVRISNPQGFLNTLTYPAGTQGVSWSVDRGPFVNRLATASAPFTSGLCTARASQSFGNLSPSQRGTPESDNDGACIGYSLSRIPVRFKDISLTGRVIALPSPDDSVASIDVTSAPVNVYGVLTNTLTISSNGWLVPKSYSGDSNYINKVSPNTTAPDVGGVIAPFWDDLRFLSTRSGSALLVQRFVANEDPNEPRPHWVIQWNKSETYLQNDTLTFEVKLFDAGDIEYHYATMRSGSNANQGSGNTATVWLESPEPAPSRALVFSINRPSITSNMALRFTRVP
jgi:hypothetical protein